MVTLGLEMLGLEAKHPNETLYVGLPWICELHKAENSVKSGFPADLRLLSSRDSGAKTVKISLDGWQILPLTIRQAVQTTNLLKSTFVKKGPARIVSTSLAQAFDSCLCSQAVSIDWDIVMTVRTKALELLFTVPETHPAMRICATYPQFSKMALSVVSLTSALTLPT